MSKSQQNKKRTAHIGNDERLWRRQLEHGRLTPRVPATDDAAPARPAADREDPDAWRRELEHGRLSALALPQGLAYAGPGAAPVVAAIAKDEAMKAGQAIAAGAGSLEREIIKAKATFMIRKQTMGLLRNWIACWIFIPVVFGIMISTNEKLRKTSARFKEAQRGGGLQVPKTPDEATKFQLKNITWVLLADWMQWTAWTCLWYGLLFLVVVLIVLIIQIVKCGLTLGLIC